MHVHLALPEQQAPMHWRSSPNLRNVPADALVGLVEKLKSMYEESGEALYSNSQGKAYLYAFFLSHLLPTR